MCDNTDELSIIRALNPDLIVLNWELRRRSGLDIYRQLRLVDSRVPIVIITAEDEDGCRSALEKGAQICLTKPFSISDLLKAIEYHLKGEKQIVDEKQMVECSIYN